jgi:hypothetical protein
MWANTDLCCVHINAPTHSHSPHSHTPASGSGGPSQHSHNPHSHSPMSSSSGSSQHSHTPHSHYPHSHSPMSGSGGSGDICSIINPNLPPVCTCQSTNNGAGLFAECSESLPLSLGDVGIRVEIEPCDCMAPYAQISYATVGDWTTVQRLAVGETVQFGIPGVSASVLGITAGLYANAHIEGTRDDMTLTVSLSMCVQGVCDGQMAIIGSAVSAAGFPIQVLQYSDISFTDMCSRYACTSSDTPFGVIGGAVGGCLLVALVTALLWKRKQQARTIFTPPAVVVTSTVPATSNIEMQSVSQDAIKV